jgi:hypothetical protein
MSMQACADTVHSEHVQADSIRRRISRNQIKVASLMTELGQTGDPYLALANGLQRSIAHRVERLLVDHPRFNKRFEATIKECVAVIKDEERQATKLTALDAYMSRKDS